MRTTAIALLLLAGCIDEFHGSNVQIDLSPGTPGEASTWGVQAATELPDNIHYTLYAFEEDTPEGGTPVGRLFAVERFEIHKIIDLQSPCFIDVGDHVPFPGLHVSQYASQVMAANGFTDPTAPPAGATETQKEDVATAIQRQRNVEALASDQGLKVVTGASAGAYPLIAADCNDTTGIPPPTCVDAAANQRRLAMCTSAWSNDPEFYEGTDRVLTVPLNGKTHGYVDGQNPVNLAPVGGAQFFVDESLENFQGYAIYWQYDFADSKDIGTQLLFGKPTMPTRGVIHVHMKNQTNSSITADVAIFANLDQDDTHF